MKKLIALVLVLVMVMSIAACSGTSNSAPEASGSEASVTEASSSDEGASAGKWAPTTAYQKTLTIAAPTGINEQNPLMQNDQINNICIALTHQPLIYQDNETLTNKPGLASWEWEDDNTLVFHLREGVKFSDGTPLTAEDCVYTFEMAKSPDCPVSNMLKSMTSFEARDEHTFVVHTTGFDNELVNVFCYYPFSIQSKAAWESGMDKPYMIGSGQYVCKEWVEGSHSSYVKNENYWGTFDIDDWFYSPGVAEEITFRVIPEASSRVIALQNGEVDVCIDPPATEIKFLEEDKNVEVFQKPGTRLFFLSSNVEAAPLDNKTLRQAISCAIDKETILQIVLEGRGKTQTTVVNRGIYSFYDEPDLGGYTYDVDRAKSLLSEAGYQPGELKLTLHASTSDPYKTIAPIVQANLKEIGIDVEIITMDDATLKAACQNGEQQLYLWRWNVSSLKEIFGELFSSGYASNYNHFYRDFVDTKTAELLQARTEEERDAISLELQKYLADECPQIPLYVANLVIAYRNGLSGTYLFGGGNHSWARAYIAQ